MKLLFIIDANALLYRSYYAIRELNAPDGTPTNAVFGFLKKLQSVIDNQKPDALAIIFDGAGPSFRKQIYSAYKANRTPMPDNLFIQLNLLYKIIPELGLKYLSMPNVEADDVIASLAVQAAANKVNVEILTGDKDLAGVVSDGNKETGSIMLLTPKKEFENEKLLDSQGVKEKFGVLPEQITDFLSLMGDSSDNIPGVEGIGEKTAAKLLEQYSTIDNIIANFEKLQPRIKNAIERSKDNLELSRKLVLLKKEIEVPVNLEFYPANFSLTEEGKMLLSKLGFNSFLENYSCRHKDELPFAQLQNPQTLELQNSIPNTIILDAIKFREVLNNIPGDSIVAVDTETTSLEPRNAKLVGVSFYYGNTTPYYLPISHSELNPSSESLELLAKFISDPKIKKCGHNIKYDIQVFRNADIDTASFVFDSMVGAAISEPGKPSYSLDALSKELFSYDTIHYNDLGGDLFNLPIDKAAQYAGQDAFFAEQFRKYYQDKINKDKSLSYVYYEIEHPLIFAIAEIEWNGIYVDKKMLSKLESEFSIDLLELQKAIWKEAGKEFNLNSPKQVSAILFDKFGLTPIKKIKTGGSTDQQSLEALSHIAHLPALILEYREVAKLLSTYVKALPELINQKTGRIHTSFNQIRTSTGRLASSKPNLQNIPIRSERGKKIRMAFRAPENRTLISADYSQIEFRVAAFLSQDLNLLEALRKGEDLHSETAKLLFKNEWNDESERGRLRRTAKTVNFGILYGQSAFGLSNTLGISRKEAKEIIEGYFTAFPRVKSWMQEIIENARKDCKVQTLYGRQRLIPELASRNKTARESAERMAINTIIQGTAADAIKIAMVSIYNELRNRKADASVILQIHDEILVEAELYSSDEIKKVIKEKMLNIPIISGILDISIGEGSDWLTAAE